MSDDEEVVMTKTKLYDLIIEVQKTTNEIVTTLDNGLKTEVERNSENIQRLDNTVENLVKKLDKNDTETKTRSNIKDKMQNKAAWIVAILAGISNVIMALVAMGVV